MGTGGAVWKIIGLDRRVVGAGSSRRTWGGCVAGDGRGGSGAGGLGRAVCGAKAGKVEYVGRDGAKRGRIG